MDAIKTTAEAIEAAALPEAYAVHINTESNPCAEAKPIPSSMTEKPIEQKSPAEWAYERIVLYTPRTELTCDIWRK